MILSEISREEEQSFLSTSDKEQKQQINLKSEIKMLPPLYVSISMLVLFAAIFTQFQYSKVSTFPLFLELPFQKNQLFTIGNALISLIGIIIYYLVYQANQRKSKSRQQFSAQIFLSGILSHLSFLAFALLPIEYKNQSNFLYTEDRVLLTFSFIMNFTFTTYYMYYKQTGSKSKLRNKLEKQSINHQIKAALYIVICFLFTAIISVNLISVFMGMPMEQGEPSMDDGLSADEDFIAGIISEIYSTLSYSLYLMNSSFIGMFYSDLKEVSCINIKINLILNVEEEMMKNKLT